MTAMALAQARIPSAQAAGLVAGGSFTLGSPSDLRVPDHGFHGAGTTPRLYFDAAAHRVEEPWVVDPLPRTVRIWQLAGGMADEETGRSDLLDLTAASVERDLAWSEE